MYFSGGHFPRYESPCKLWIYLNHKLIWWVKYLCVLCMRFWFPVLLLLFIWVNYFNKYILFSELLIWFTTRKSLDNKVPRCWSKNLYMVSEHTYGWKRIYASYHSKVTLGGNQVHMVSADLGDLSDQGRDQVHIYGLQEL